jgi:hypothetical protein
MLTDFKTFKKGDNYALKPQTGLTGLADLKRMLYVIFYNYYF